uniref:Putative secreted mucin n=1 Tax=Anopheles triannulatus TaxID=58253 RepID=A0A2M4AAU5_9DIPT
MAKPGFLVLFVCSVFCGSLSVGNHAGGGGEYDLHDLNSICPMRRSILDSLLTRKEIRHLYDFQRGAIYEQSLNSSTFKRYSECKFTLQAPPGYGLYLIIRKLKLRREANGNCVDSVTVKNSNDKKVRFCYTPRDVPRSFTDPLHLKITIKIDHYRPLATEDSTLDIQLVATPKGSCSQMPNRLQCEPNDPLSCIHDSFRHDRNINCPNCLDEDGCTLEMEQVPVVNKQNVVLTAIVAFVIALGAMGLITWIVYQCWCARSCNAHSANSANGGGLISGRNGPLFRSNNGASSATAPDILATEELHGSSLSDVRPSAPPVEEKDLPPSYDVLFPTADASNNAPSGPTTVSTATSPTIPKPLER